MLGVQLALEVMQRDYQTQTMNLQHACMEVSLRIRYRCCVIMSHRGTDLRPHAGCRPECTHASAALGSKVEGRDFESIIVITSLDNTQCIHCNITDNTIDMQSLHNAMRLDRANL